MSGHGGARRGAGRPPKYDFWEMVGIGHACETRWRKASDAAADTRLAALPHSNEIRRIWEIADALPVSQRKAWLESEAYEDHSGEIEALLHKRAGHRLSEGFEVEGQTYGADYEDDAPRLVNVSTRPPRGTRKRIICEVASEKGLPESVIDNLWQAYRRLQRELHERDKAANT